MSLAGVTASRHSSQRPLSAILQDVRVLLVGLGSETETCHALVKEMGGVVLGESDRNRAPTVVAARDVTTEKYQAARDMFKVPVVKPEWFRACKGAGRQLPFTGHLVGPFEGLKVCATGVSPPDRTNLKNLVTKGGGDFSPSLTKDCTHLVCLSPCDPASKKLHMAKKWKVALVVRQWVFDSSEKQVRQDEKMYPVAVASSASGSQGLAPTSAGGAPSHQKPPASAAQHHASRLRQQSGGADVLSANGGGTRSSTGIVELSDWNASDASGCPRGDSAISRRAPGSLSDERLFLDGVRVVLSCCSPTEAAEAARLARTGGATRQPGLSWSTTHIILGSERPSSTSALSLANLRTHMGRFSAHTTLVSPLWLRDCAAQREKLEPDERHLVPASEILQSHEQPRMSSLSNVQPSLMAPSAKQAAQAPAKPSAAAGAAAPASAPPQPPSRAADDESHVLSGIKFVLVALDPYPQLKQKVMGLISEGGGIMYPEGATLASVGRDENPYAVCPWGFPPSDQEKAAQSDLFQHVDKKRKVTIHWLEFCINQKKQLRSPIVSLLFQPLPHEFPLPWMAEVKIVTSSYDEDRTWILRTMTRQLGGKFTSKMSSKNTHLLVPETLGDKFMSCDKLNVTPVTCDWLLACAAKGIRVPEHKCYPKPATNPVAGNGPHPSQLPSQIPHTQLPAAGAPRAAPHNTPGLLSMTQAAGSQQPDFLDRLLESHKVPQSQVAPPSRGFKKPDPPRPSAVQSYLDKLMNEEDARGSQQQQQVLGGGGSGQDKPRDTTAAAAVADADEDADAAARLKTVEDGTRRGKQGAAGKSPPATPAEKGGAQQDEADRIVADLLRVAEEADSSQILPGHLLDQGLSPPSTDTMPRTRSRGAKRGPAGVMDPGGLGRRTRRAVARQMPPNDSSNPEVDFMASQMDADSKVVYQQGEKTAQALQRCSGRPVRASRHSAKEFLNRAVLSGIDSNADKTDELKEMGLL